MRIEDRPETLSIRNPNSAIRNRNNAQSGEGLQDTVEKLAFLLWKDGAQIEERAVFFDPDNNRRTLRAQPGLDKIGRVATGLDGQEHGWQLALRAGAAAHNRTRLDNLNLRSFGKF